MHVKIISHLPSMLCVRVHALECMCACARECICACLRACLPMCVCTHARTGGGGSRVRDTERQRKNESLEVDEGGVCDSEGQDCPTP